MIIRRAGPAWSSLGRSLAGVFDQFQIPATDPRDRKRTRALEAKAFGSWVIEYLPHGGSHRFRIPDRHQESEPATIQYFRWPVGTIGAHDRSPEGEGLYQNVAKTFVP